MPCNIFLSMILNKSPRGWLAFLECFGLSLISGDKSECCKRIPVSVCFFSQKQTTNVNKTKKLLNYLFYFCILYIPWMARMQKTGTFGLELLHGCFPTIKFSLAVTTEQGTKKYIRIARLLDEYRKINSI